MMRFQCFAFMVLTAFVLGCGGGGDSFKGAYGQVSGKITHDGKSIPEGSLVTFMAKEGPQYIATGKVNGSGEYTLSYNGKPNVPAITYLVQLTPPINGAPGPTQMSPDQMASAGGVGSTAATTLPFPAKYSVATTSKLSFDVKAGKSTADFDLPK